MSDLNKDAVFEIFGKVTDPDFEQDIVTLDRIKDLQIDGKKVSIKLELPSYSKPLKEHFLSEIENKLRENFSDIKEVNIDTEVNVSTHKNDQKEKVLPGVKNTIAVASGKGGVGKSTVAVNLAVALAEDGAKVGLVDADVYGPSIPMMLGINEQPKVYQEAKSQKMVPLENYGIKLMSLGFLVDEQKPVIWRGPMASGAVKQFMSDVSWGELDYLVFDLPPGTGDIQLTLVQTIPLTGAVTVTTPQNVSLIDARKAFKMFGRVNVDVFGVIENMSYFIAPDTGTRYDIFGSGGGERVSKELETNYIGGIPLDPRIREGGDNGVPIVHDMPDSEHAEAIMNISRRLAAQVNIKNSKDKTPEVEIDLGDNS